LTFLYAKNGEVVDRDEKKQSKSRKENDKKKRMGKDKEYRKDERQ